jgi:hypothetical protein
MNASSDEVRDMDTQTTIGCDVEPESTFPHLAMRASSAYRVNGPSLLFSVTVSNGDAKAPEARRLLRDHHRGSHSNGAFS